MYIATQKKIQKLWALRFRRRKFLCFSHDAPGAGPVRTPGALLAGFIKRTTIHCYAKYESPGPCGFGEVFFMFFP